MRIAIVLPGLHRVLRGAEVAFESIARGLGTRDDCDVTLFGSGQPRPDEPYDFVHVGCRPRERFESWPAIPPMRSDTVWEELSFLPGLWRRYDPAAFDVTVTCSYPFCNWLLRARKRRGRRPTHIYVTQNGDWAPQALNREFKRFACDGLVCTNPDYYDRNCERWRCALIPNGVDPSRFHPGPAERAEFDLPADAPVILMVSALIESKRVREGLEAAARVDGVHVRVAGDGPCRDNVDQTGQKLLGERYRRISVPRDRMPALYRSADLFLHMSQIEPSANAYIEALSTGLPIVTHDRRVTQWTFDGQAILVDTADYDAVADGVRRALEQRGPEHVAARRTVVEARFAWSKIAEQYVEFIEQVRANGATR